MNTPPPLGVSALHECRLMFVYCWTLGVATAVIGVDVVEERKGQGHFCFSGATGGRPALSEWQRHSADHSYTHASRDDAVVEGAAGVGEGSRGAVVECRVLFVGRARATSGRCRRCRRCRRAQSTAAGPGGCRYCNGGLGSGWAMGGGGQFGWFKIRGGEESSSGLVPLLQR